jgi:hypothetical protein
MPACHPRTSRPKRAPASIGHMYDLSHSLNRQGAAGRVFLRAERTPGDQRTYRLVPGAPGPTRNGPDLYLHTSSASPRRATVPDPGRGRGR